MDISGPLRQLLLQHLPPASTDPFRFAARLITRHSEPAEVWPVVAPQIRPAYDRLALALQLRTLPRLGRDPREALAKTLTETMQDFTTRHQKLFFSRAAPAVDQLWFYWLLVLARKRLKFTVIDTQLKVLWQNAWSKQTKEAGNRGGGGTLHPLAPDASPDTAAYNDLIALHVAYNAILLTQDFDLFPPVQKLADYLVQTTQPDHITTEPWALAAFAALDPTNTFAPQQLHDTTTQLALSTTHPILLGLLADALLSQEEAAEA